MAHALKIQSSYAAEGGGGPRVDEMGRDAEWGAAPEAGLNY
jgi:hypothetical protein